MKFYAEAPSAERSAGDVLAARLDLASAYLTLNDLDATRENLAVVLATPQVHRTASIVKRADGIGKRLAAVRYVQAPRSNELRSELREFCAPPPALPPGEPEHAAR